MIFTIQDAQKLQDELKTKGEAVIISRSTLGGEHNASLSILIQFDKAETWSNKIWRNGKYAQFMIHSGEDKLTLLTQNQAHAYRKTKIKSVEELIVRLQNYINQVEGGEVELIPLPKLNKQGQEVKADIEIMTLIEVSRLVVEGASYKLIRECKEQVKGEPRKYEVKDDEGNRKNNWSVWDLTTAGTHKQVFDFVSDIAANGEPERAEKAAKTLKVLQAAPLDRAINYIWKLAGK